MVSQDHLHPLAAKKHIWKEASRDPPYGQSDSLVSYAPSLELMEWKVASMNGLEKLLDISIYFIVMFCWSTEIPFKFPEWNMT